MKTMERTPPPSVVVVLGWVFIALSTVGVLSSLLIVAFAFLVIGHIPEPTPPPETLNRMPGEPVLFLVFRHFRLLSIVQSLAATLLLVASVQFLRLRSWARSVLEAFAWFWLLYLVSFAIWFSYVWYAMTRTMPTEKADGFPTMLFSLFGIIAGLFNVLVWAIPVGVAIWLLRHPTVRSAMMHSFQRSRPAA